MLVILNPRAAGGRTGRLRSEVERALSLRRMDFDIVVTEGAGHASELAAEGVRTGVHAVVAVGGDGTVHEVANGLLRPTPRQSLARPDPAGLGGASAPSPTDAAAPPDATGRPALGVVPAGTGNDFAKLLGTPFQRPRAYDTLASARIRALDAGLVTWEGGSEYFVNGMGTGIDVEVVRQIERLPRMPGPFSYLLGLFSALARYRLVPVRLTADGMPLERRVMVVAIGNGPCQGGGFYLCPAAEADDGRFDVCIIVGMGWSRIVRTLPKVMRGTHVGAPGVEMLQAARIRIEAAGDAPLFFHLDGELREPPGIRRFDVSVRAGALRVLFPT